MLEQYGITAEDLDKDEEALKLRQAYQLASAMGDPVAMAQARAAFRNAVPKLAQKINTRKEYGPGEAAMIGAGSAVNKYWEGARNIYGKVTGDEEIQQQALADRAERQDLMAPLQEAYPTATAAGEMLPEMIVPGGASKSILGRALTAGGTGAGLRYLETGGEAPVEDVLISGASGAIGNEVGRLANRALIGPPGVRPDDMPVHRRNVREAQDLGLQLSPAQRSGHSGMLQTEASLRSKPYTSAPFVEMDEQNQGVANRMLRRELGLEDTTEPIDDATLSELHERLGREFEARLGSNHQFYATGELFDQADRIRDQVSRGILRDPAGVNMVDNTIERFGTRGRRKPATIRDYQQTRSDLARLERTSTDPTMARAAGDLKDALDTEFEKTFPSDGELGDLRRRYAVVRNVEKAKALQGGNFSPLRFYNYQRNKFGHVEPGQPLNDIAATSHYFRDTLGNSGTATRHAIADFANASNTNRMLMLLGNPLTRAYVGASRMTPGLGIPEPIPSALEMLTPRAGREMGRDQVR